MSLREAGKQKRRQLILEAAEALIREHEGVGFSMRELAKKAEVAFVTPFNLFTSKGGVIAGLLEARLDAQRERLIPVDEAVDPIDRIFDLALRGSRAYTADPELYRPILQALPSIEGVDDARLLALATELWRLALRDAENVGMIETGRDLDLLSRTLHITFRGALWFWVAGGVDVPELERQVQYGAGTCLLAVLTTEHRERVADRLRTLEADRPAAEPTRREG